MATISSTPCPTCHCQYRDIQDHIRKIHPTTSYSPQQIASIGLATCYICLRPFKDDKGVRAHAAKAHGRFRLDEAVGRATPTATPSLQSRTNPSFLPPRTTHSSLPRPLRFTTPPTRHPLKDDSAPPQSTIPNTTTTPLVPPSPRLARKRLRSRSPPSSPAKRARNQSLGSKERPIPIASRSSSPLPSTPLPPYSFASSPTRSRTNTTTSSPIPSSPSISHDSITKEIVESSPYLATLLRYRSIKPIEKPLHARYATLFTETSNRLISEYLNTPSEENLFYFLLLPKVLSLALSGTTNSTIATTLKAYPSTIPLPPTSDANLDNDEDDSDIDRTTLEEDRTLELALARASSLLERGLVGRASRAIVSPATIASPSRETLKALEEKHPIGPTKRFNSRTNPPPARPLVEKDIRSAFATFAYDVASGIDGWTVPLLKLVIEKGKGLDLLLSLTNRASKGIAKGASLLLTSRLIPLEKKDGGVRPIAVSSLIYRLITKAILGAFFTEDSLLPSQLGVGSKLGVEPAIALLNSSLEEGGYSSITSLDLKNAFNSISRSYVASGIANHAPSFFKLARWAYNDPTILATRTGLLASTMGVRQGDPLGPLFFSLAIRPLLKDLGDRLAEIGATIISYIDDIYILSKGESSQILDIAEEVLASYDLVLNRKKSSTTPISTIRTSDEGLQVLGTVIGSRVARRLFLATKIETFRSILDRLRQLSKQKGLLLLRGSISLLLRHLLRTLDPSGIEDLWHEVDDLIYDYIRFLRGLESERPHDRDIIALPTRNGGLGIPSFAEAALDTYTTSNRLSRDFLVVRGYKITPYRDPNVFLVPDDFLTPDQEPPDPPPPPPSLREIVAENTTRRQERLASTTTSYEKRALLENSSYLGRRWLDILPLSKPHTIADIEIEAALRTRFLVSSLSFSSTQPNTTRSSCQGCLSEPTTLLNHEDTCRGAVKRWIQRHNAIRDSLVRGLNNNSSIKALKEPTIEGLDVRPDLVVATATSKLFYDVQIVAINADSADTDPYRTLEIAEKAKIAKYSKLGPSFRPLIFSSGGLLSKKSSVEYKKIQTLVGPAASYYLDSSISLILLRTRAQARNSLEI
jgi:hypothetical protein